MWLHTNVACNLQELDSGYVKANTNSLCTISLICFWKRVSELSQLFLKWVQITYAAAPPPNNLYFGKSGVVLHRILLLSFIASGISSIPSGSQEVTINYLECAVNICRQLSASSKNTPELLLYLKKTNKQKHILAFLALPFLFLLHITALITIIMLVTITFFNKGKKKKILAPYSVFCIISSKSNLNKY